MDHQRHRWTVQRWPGYDGVVSELVTSHHAEWLAALRELEALRAGE
jgi:hypothetical protein